MLRLGSRLSGALMNRRAAAADSQQDRGGYIRCPTSRPMLWWECCIQHGDLHLGLVRLLSNPVIESPVIVIADGRANRPLIVRARGEQRGICRSAQFLNLGNTCDEDAVFRP